MPGKMAPFVMTDELADYPPDVIASWQEKQLP